LVSLFYPASSIQHQFVFPINVNNGIPLLVGLRRSFAIISFILKFPWKYSIHPQEEVLRIAITAEGSDLEAKVGDRFGLCQYMLIIDTETKAFEAVLNPGVSGQGGAGIQAVVLAIEKKVRAVLTGYMSPTAKGHLTANGIEVVTGVGGSVAVALEQYKTGDLQKQIAVLHKPESRGDKFNRVAFAHALRSSAKQFATMVPILTGVVLIIGILDSFVSKAVISAIFSENLTFDTLWGACLGSILAGNPINSYVIGGELLGYGVSLFAVTAFITAWVTVGLVQLPAEIAALGKRFAVARNSISFALSIAIAIFTVVILNFFTR